MLKMILADDEPIITKGIQMLVDWTQYGIQIVGEFSDGKAALHGMISLKPDIAILDISMPYKTGIEIIREIKNYGIDTKIIFLSGFQDFEYAREALRFGAVDYLLKPVKKESLISCIEKCIAAYAHGDTEPADIGHKVSYENKLDSSLPPEAYEHLVQIEQTNYIPVLVEVINIELKNTIEQRLIKFSVYGIIEEYLKVNSCGIVFYKNSRICVVLKGVNEVRAKQIIYELIEEVERISKNLIGAIIASSVNDMKDIPISYEEGLKLLGYYFFADFMKLSIISKGEKIFLREYTMEELGESRNKIVEFLLNQEIIKLQEELPLFQKKVCVLSDGEREKAAYHYLNCLRNIDERMDKIGVKGKLLHMNAIIEAIYKSKTFTIMSETFEQYVKSYSNILNEYLKENDKRDILKAKNYIEDHYKENVSLEVLANYIHMNPSYFSSYFKKQTGENFKDYLNKVRMEHAMELLMSTDKKSYEIAEEVGFRDNRYFSELFQRYYGKSPSAYRKKLLNTLKERGR